jgi:hypothetical protein
MLDKPKNKKVKLWEESFSIVKAKKNIPNAFAVVKDKNEITVIIDSSKVNDNETLQIEADWKLLTFDLILPFSEVGFIAKISQALAKAKISIFVISSFSTDHILVKEIDLQKTVKVLEQLGYIVKL